jgi:hypothetical protein
VIAGSLHIGLNKVSPEAYNGWGGALNGCLNDAAGLSLLATRFGSDSTTGLVTGDDGQNMPTIDAFRVAITELSDLAMPGQTVLMSYSGHGGDDVGYGQSICLYDGQLYEHQLRALLASFREGVRWVFIFDSCHSGGLDRAFMQPLPRVAPVAALRNQPPPGYIAGEIPILSSGVMFCACQPEEVAYDGGEFGAWTGSLIRCKPDKRAGAITPQNWFDAAYDITPEQQHPVLRLLGKDHDWLQQPL